MRAQVLGAKAGRTDSTIRLMTSGGEVRGTWRGDQPVDPGDIFDVELDIRESHMFDELDLAAEPRAGFRIGDNDSMAITGRVVEIDHQDVMMLEVGGTFLSIEMEGVAPVGIVGTLVTVVVQSCDVYPTGM